MTKILNKNVSITTNNAIGTMITYKGQQPILKHIPTGLQAWIPNDAGTYSFFGVDRDPITRILTYLGYEDEQE